MRKIEIEVEMKKLVTVTATVFLLTGCATQKVDVDADGVEIRQKGMPNWVYAPNEYCNQAKYICASSEGANIEAADVNAKKSLASIFETNIKSKFEMNTTAMTQEEKTEMSEQVVSEVEENLDVVMQAVQILQRYETDVGSYSLAALDKRKAAKTLRIEVESIDDQMAHLIGLKQKIAIPKLMMLYNKRLIFNDRLVIVTGTGVDAKYSYSQIQDLKYSLGTSRVQVTFKGESASTFLEKWFEQALGESGYEVSSEKPSYIVTVEQTTKPEYLNVPGFKKFSFTTQVAARDNIGNQVGSFIVTLTATGRNETDAYIKIKKDLEEKLNQNLEKLNMK